MTRDKCLRSGIVTIHLASKVGMHLDPMKLVRATRETDSTVKVIVLVTDIFDISVMQAAGTVAEIAVAWRM